MAQLYDEIGVGYSERRRPDPRIARAIQAALGDARTVLNVGAGTGSYEPAERGVVALEPSREMIDQRSPNAAPAVQADAVHLPFCDDSFDASLAVLTVHHWSDPARGFAEMRRVARERFVVLTWAAEGEPFWLYEYFPEILEIDKRIFPPTAALCETLGGAHSTPVPIPWDCVDGFLGAYWRRPHVYLDAAARGAISSFGKIERTDEGLRRLRADLEDGTWMRRHRSLLEREALDLGYRLVTAVFERRE
jgi:SAM-dependent methyltransferase